MTFSFTKTHEILVGDRKIIYGTFTNTSPSTGGVIETNLRVIENFSITYLGTSVITDAPVLNASLTTVGGKQVIALAMPKGEATVVLTTSTNGFWSAIGV